MNRNESVIYSYIQSVAKYNKCSSNLEHLYDECIEADDFFSNCKTRARFELATVVSSE